MQPPADAARDDNPADAPDRSSPRIGNQAVQGAAWLGGGQLLRQGLGFITMSVLARLLTPDDFGLFGMTYLAAEAGQIITNFGFGSAIVQRQASSPRLLSACFWTNVLIGLGIAVAVAASGPLLALYFRRPEVQGLLLPLALNLLLSAAVVVPQALLTQRLAFRSMIVAQTVGSVAAALGALGSAMLGWGYWSLAVQPLVGTLVTGGLMVRSAGWWPSRSWAFADLGDLLGFSSKLLASNLVGFSSRNMPGIILGRQLGAAQLALFGTASHLTGSVIYQISSVVVRVLFPTLSALKDDLERLRSAWLRATVSVAALVLPIMLGVAALAADVVRVLLGPQWDGAAVPLAFLSISMAAQAVLTTASTVLLSLGHAGALMRLSIVSAVSVGLGLFASAQFGLNVASAVFAVISIALNVVTTWLACNACGQRKRSLVQALAPWLGAALFSAASIATLPLLLPDVPSLVRVLIAVPLGLAVYIGGLAVLARRAAWQLGSEIWSRLRG
ncbi:lipopolysaccharide biosynthesis protein [Roseateles cellulosilyticus]|uniref:Lipopolysaccharide biosynthesis protein n=1 Tax=Pelomonas cellulosilytica TaxID=2906762 RepID=A0ABS8Y1N1_9BURK|nr:lipopolysaccharide biosynthesis protein [Pelomonas sp. P8]MCE4557568.1 lipopolysaccharide biosynthesis protein [Pelomonas sp. P8]